MKYKEILLKQETYFNLGITKNYYFRKEALQSLKDAIIKNEDKIFDALYKDLGKSKEESYLTEIGLVLKEINYHLKHLKKHMKPKKVKTPLSLFPAKSYLYKEPYGKVLIISPWNYPFLLALNPLVGLIAAGNTAVIKPSEYSVNTSLLIEEIINDTFDSSFVKVVQGEVEETTKLLEQRFDYIFFTGSSKVGKIIMKKASENLTPVTLELGGKSPVVVTKGVNLKLAAKRIAFGKVVNAGQTCIAPDYLMIEKDLIEDFTKYYKDALSEFFGDDLLNNNNYPKIINKNHHKRLKKLLEDEKILLGGKSSDEKIEPTLVEIKNISSPLMQEEIFGPILPIIIYKDMGDVYSYIRSGKKPLAAYIFTNNKDIRKDFIDNISAGGIVVNDTIMHFANNNLPFGGVGSSGIGKYHGKYSFETFSNTKAVLHRKTYLDLKLRYQPISKKEFKVIKKFLK